MTRRTAWTVAFLSVTAVAVGMEGYAAADGNPDTDPWTFLIVDHLPAGLTFAAIAALTAWLGPHFAAAYRARKGATVEIRPIPLPTGADAKNRAWRTLAQGVALDVTAAVVLAVAPSLLGHDFAWTEDYWSLIGLLAAKTAIQTAVSYWMRHAMPPPSGDPQPAPPDLGPVTGATSR